MSVPRNINQKQFGLMIAKKLRLSGNSVDTYTLYTIKTSANEELHAILKRLPDRDFGLYIPLEPYHSMCKDGYPLSLLIDEITRLSELDPATAGAGKVYFQYKMAKPYIVARLVSPDSRSDHLDHVPCRRILDMMMLYYLYLPLRNGQSAYAPIFKEQLHAWRVTEQDLFCSAIENMPRLLPANPMKLERLSRILLPACGLSESLNKTDLHRLTNSTCRFGANAILYPGFLKALSNQIHSDMYLLPSSIHEFIAVPERQGVTRTKLKELLEKIRYGCPDIREVLSNSIYLYQADSDRIEIIGSILKSA